MRSSMLLLALLVLGCGKGTGSPGGTKTGEAAAPPGVAELTEYKRKAMGTEATVNVKKLFVGAVAYYEDEHMAPGSVTVAPRQFPASVSEPTPAPGTCCKQPKGLCQPDAALWKDPAWQALMFSVEDPFRYSYYFKSSGSGPGATFSAGAIGDLDCDGELSTFEMVGSVQADGTVSGSAGMYKEKPLE